MNINENDLEGFEGAHNLENQSMYQSSNNQSQVQLKKEDDNFEVIN